MQNELQSTDPYKGVRDFYPADMVVQQYIFDMWRTTANSFGYEEYTASTLEAADLYRAKGAASEEIVNDQTYTFTDRGGREVTLRPEMTPTVARMIAGKQRELAFPVRWFSIPNVFRYERPQKGRLREHYQLNCDMFGNDSVEADIEMIALAYRVFTDFGATPDMFEIRLNDRAWLNERFDAEDFTHEQRNAMLYLLDRSSKIDNFADEAEKIAGKPFDLGLTEPAPDSRLSKVMAGLASLGITNTKISLATVRGFNYYTGTIFELFDISGENNRSLAGGGRYDNLTELFSTEPVTGIGFGLGDVTMRDFLETHNLLPENLYTGPTIALLPVSINEHLPAMQVADTVRAAGLSASVDISTRKIGKKIAAAATANAAYVITVGEDEAASDMYTIKHLETGQETTGSLSEIISSIVMQT
jgi:histidyl-tRNA synthetase